jgi:hypothetical protein
MNGNKPDGQEQLPLDLNLPPSGKPAPETEPVDEGRILEWVSHPAKRNMRTTVIVTLFLFLLLVVIYFMTFSVWFTVLGFMILYGSLSSFYFPTRYKFSEKEITIKTTMQTLKKQWSQYRSFYPDKNGVLLSPFVRPTRLENFRGIYIRFAKNREDVIAFVKMMLVKDNPEKAEGK